MCDVGVDFVAPLLNLFGLEALSFLKGFLHRRVTNRRDFWGLEVAFSRSLFLCENIKG